VQSVEPGDAIRYLHTEPGFTGNEEAFEYVDYYDDSAHERDVVVTLEVDWSSGPDVGRHVKFRFGVLGGGDPDKFMADIRSLKQGRVVVLLARDGDGRTKGDYFPIMRGALIGQILAKGHLSFPGLGSAEKSFVGSVNTVKRLKEAAND
jgi:hypothetical protein